MKKSIYKITNLINGKVYIGQTKNIKRRIREHQQEYSSSATSKIRNAILKYGIKNFKIEILEKDIENYNEREKYWISFYDSTDRNKGYNITIGGEEPPIISGEDSYFSKFTDYEVRSIINDINKGLSYDEISNKYKVTQAYLVKLNKGEVRKLSDISYPIRRHGNERTGIQKVDTIINLLLNTTKSILQIARENNISPSTIKDINDGKCYNCPKYIQYPIRENYCRIAKQKLNELINDIKNNKLKFSEIEIKYNVSKAFVNRINNGKFHRVENEAYPLRNSSQRVY